MSHQIIAVIVLVITVGLLFCPKFPRATAAALGTLLMVMFGVLDAKTAFSQFSSSTIVTMFSMMIVGGTLFETGMASYFGRILTKITGSTEKGILLSILIFGTVVSAFVSANSAFFMFLPIVISIAIAADISVQRVIWPFTVALQIGQMVTLVGGNGNLISQNMLLEMGFEGWGFFELTPYSILLMVIMIPAIMFLGLKTVIPGRKIIPQMALLMNGQEVPQKIDEKMAKSGIILIATMIFMILDLEMLPTHVCAAIGALLCIITGCVSQKDAFAAVDFGALFMVAGMTAVAKGLQNSGIMDQIFAPVLHGLGSASPLLLIIVIYLSAAFATQFMNNSALVTILTPLALSLSIPLGIPAKALAGAVLVGSYSCSATPMATATSAPTVEIGGYTTWEYMKMGLFQLVFSGISGIAFVYFFLM